MEREYIKGNKKHWKEVYKYVHGIAPKTEIEMGICGNDKAIYIKNNMGGFTLYANSAIYDVITTNPNWHEVKPWENNWEPKPFDKVLELPFKVGDKVWFIVDNEVHEGTLTKCNIAIDKNGTQICYNVLYYSRIHYKVEAKGIASNKLFKTKKELLESL